jgi:predicted SAM-dependent methyltransferase
MAGQGAAGMETKLELGAGHRPTPGYLHCDLNPFEGIEFVSPASELDLPDESLEQVLAVGVMEHMTYEQFDATLRNVHRMLQPGGAFYFDTPDIVAWCGYLVRSVRGYAVPFSREHIYRTIYGWQRWPGDEHRSGWDRESVAAAVEKAGFVDVDYGVEHFQALGVERRRFTRPGDAHIYVVAHR